MAETTEKVKIEVTDGLRVRVDKSNRDWEVRDKDSGRVIQEGKKQ